MSEMHNLDNWRLCDNLSIFQTALLIVGQDPSGENAFVENWSPNKQPIGYEAAKTTIINALKRKIIDGTLRFEYETDSHGNFTAETETIDLSASTLSAPSLREFLRIRGIGTGFFSINFFALPSFAGTARCHKQQ